MKILLRIEITYNLLKSIKFTILTCKEKRKNIEKLTLIFI